MKKPTKKQLEKREKRRIKRENKQKKKVWREKIFERDGYACVFCKKQFGNNGGLHPSHILPDNTKTSKKYDLVRFDINNGLSACAYHHIFGQDSLHNNPIFVVEWLKKNRPQQYEYLMKKYNEINKFIIEES